MGIKNHWDQDNRIPQEDGYHRLPPVHPCFNESSGKRIGGDHDAHANPERSDVPGRPGAFSLLLFIALLCTVSLGSSWAASATNTADAAKKERATVTFSQPVHLMEATLKGQYLFVHDDVAMARGEACTYVYEGDSEIPAKLVVAFHCIPVARSKAA